MARLELKKMLRSTEMLSAALLIASTCSVGLGLRLAVASQAIDDPTEVALKFGLPEATWRDARDYFTTRAEVAFAEAAAKGDIAELERLQARGVDVNAHGRNDITPAAWAVGHRSKKGYQYLLEHGADPNVQDSVDGNSAMSLSARVADSWWLKESIARGGNVNLTNHLTKRTPILDALNSGLDREGNIRILIGAGANLNVVDKYGTPLIIVAAQHWRYELVYELLVAGADPTLPSASGGPLSTWIKRSVIPPANPQYAWKIKVVEWLQAHDVPSG